jgi:hypothetical protein
MCPGTTIGVAVSLGRVVIFDLLLSAKFVAKNMNWLPAGTRASVFGLLFVLSKYYDVLMHLLLRTILSSVY